MITTRSQYKYAIPPESMVIDGGIMPVRDVAGDGSWRVLRGEDACFLLEAAKRAQLYRAYGASVSPGEVDIAVRAADVRSAISGIVNYPSHQYSGIKYSYQGPPELNYSYVMDVGTGDVVNAVLSNARSPFVPASSPSDVSGGLYADVMRKAYYDLRKSGFFVYTGSIGWTYYGSIVCATKGYSWSEDKGWELDSQSTDQMQPPVWNVATISKRYYQTGTGADVTYNWTLTKLPPVYGSVPTSLSPLGMGDVDCYAVFTVSVSFSSLGGSSATYNDAIVRGCIINADGVVQLATPLTAQDVRGAVNGARGVPVEWGDVGNGEGVGISASPCAIIFYDPGIDTSGIDWEWQPEGEGAS